MTALPSASGSSPGRGRSPSRSPSPKRSRRRSCWPSPPVIAASSFATAPIPGAPSPIPGRPAASSVALSQSTPPSPSLAATSPVVHLSHSTAPSPLTSKVDRGSPWSLPSSSPSPSRTTDHDVVPGVPLVLLRPTNCGKCWLSCPICNDGVEHDKISRIVEHALVVMRDPNATEESRRLHCSLVGISFVKH